MDFGGFVFFGFLAAIIIVPQVLRHQERGRLHETLRLAFERGQPVPLELIAALQSGRRRYYPYGDIPFDAMAGWRPRSEVPPDVQAPPPASGFQAPPPAPDATPRPTMPPSPTYAALFPSQSGRDLRRGLIWLSIGLGLIAAGAAFYAGLYDVGGAPETFSSFAAFGAIPVFIGLTYLGLWAFAREKIKG